MSNNSFVLKDNNIIMNNANLSNKSKKRMQNVLADNTLSAYESDWRDFYQWCTYHKVNALGATEETIVNYINDLADHAKSNTVSRRLTAISENHKAAGYIDDNPVKSNLVKNALQAIKREKGTMQQGKAPILVEDIIELSTLFDTKNIVHCRDKALILLGFSGAFRRSELVSIQYEDLTFTRDGLIILLKNSKADQLGEGEYLAIPYAVNENTCAVIALQKWLNQSGIQHGPIFRPFTKKHEIKNVHLSDKSVALLVKKYMGLLGFDAKDFSGHSLRRGFASSAAQHDVDERTIMQQTRHKSEKMVRRYIEQGNMFKNNALRKMF